MLAGRTFLGLGIAALLAAASVVLPPLGQLALMLDLTVAVLWVIDWRRARSTPMAARRRFPVLLCQGATAEVVVEIEGSVTRRVVVRLRDGLHPALSARPERFEVGIPPGQRVSWRYSIEPRRRGRHGWGPITARVLGPWGFAWTQREVVGGEDVRVYPRVRWGGRVGTLLALARRRELGQSPVSVEGAGSEVYGLREYHAGDPLNRIHWRATARHGRLVTREDTWEQGAHLVVLLDCGRAMASLDDRFSKLDHALATALALMRLAVGRGDRVSLLAFSDRVERRVRVHSGAGGIRRAYETLFDLEPRLVESALDGAVEECFRLEPRRATALVCTSVTDLVTAERLQESMLRLRRRYRTLLVNLEDAEVSSFAVGRPTTVEGAFAKVAAMEIRLANQALARRLIRSGTVTVTCPSDRLALETLDAYLGLFGSVRGRLDRRAG